MDYQSTGHAYRRTTGATGYVDGTWQVVPGQATDVSVGADGSVWAIGPAADVAKIGGSHIYHYNPSSANAATNGWEQVDGGAVAVAVGPNGQPWIVNKQGSMYARSRGKTGYVDGAWATVAPNGSAAAIGVGGTR